MRPSRHPNWQEFYLRYVKGRFECSEYFLHLVEEEQDPSSNTDPFEFDPKSMHRDHHRAINGPVYPLGNRVEARPRMTAAKVKANPVNSTGCA